MNFLKLTISILLATFIVSLGFILILSLRFLGLVVFIGFIIYVIIREWQKN